MVLSMAKLEYELLFSRSVETLVHVFFQLHYRHLPSNKKDCTVKILILTLNFPLALFDNEVSFNINNCTQNIKRVQYDRIEYHLQVKLFS